MKTLAKCYSDQRIQQKLTVTEAAKKAGVERTTIWKIENGKSVRAATLKQALRGINITERSPLYSQFFAIWTDERGGVGSGISGHLDKTKSAEERMVRKLLADIPRDELDMVVKAISDHGIRAMLPGLLELRAKQK